ncbi:hypothetical protein WJX77_005878 [Trebouxia sp. C0004]
MGIPMLWGKDGDVGPLPPAFFKGNKAVALSSRCSRLTLSSATTSSSTGKIQQAVQLAIPLLLLTRGQPAGQSTCSESLPANHQRSREAHISERHPECGCANGQSQL